MAATATPNATQGIRTAYQRSRDIRDYVLRRAGQTCEGCELDAPFLRRNGSPYLEPHHTRRLSDGGPDNPRFVIGLCPTCHRRVHHGADGDEYNDTLIAKLAVIEP
ncbi:MULTISPECIES: HNH endonuclease [unclassified Mesorhizobium]|uniref:HNH endonuclease n=1 Tax=unclassified Mesorhizobium TaxID=325217 RepID=UPI0024157D36|nr:MULTISPECIES: HNH endonuclease [unclassified Mesorhizobium]MDG4854570.1 HNH endonuclease [Mesorhizobium sp. WSM4982]MDG4916107.1 HNH endonuclease [Mesorhizobium sp. WSM4983]